MAFKVNTSPAMMHKLANVLVIRPIRVVLDRLIVLGKQGQCV